MIQIEARIDPTKPSVPGGLKERWGLFLGVKFIRFSCCVAQSTVLIKMSPLPAASKPLSVAKIELPKNWDKLVAKYKDIKPNYEMY